VKKCISMISRGLDHLSDLEDLKNNQIKTSQAAESMEVSLRHVYRLKNNLTKEGPERLVLKKVEAPSNHQMDKDQAELAAAFFKKPQHGDFGPTLAHEYLVEKSGLSISLSSVRSIKQGLLNNELLIPPQVILETLKE
jgi:hypothetical protein